MEGIKEIYELIQEMHDLIKNENNDNKLIEILLGIIVLTSPSIIYIFIFKREIFNDLSEFKLILLCVLINLIVFLIFYKIIITKDRARFDEKLVKCDYYLIKYRIEIKSYMDEIELYGKEVEKVSLLVKEFKDITQVKNKIKSLLVDLKKLKQDCKKGIISKSEYKLKKQELYLNADINKYKEIYMNYKLSEDIILEGSKSIEKLEEIEKNCDMNKKSIMLDKARDNLISKCKLIRLEIQNQKYRIFKEVSFNMVILSLIPLIMYVLVTMYNYVFKTKYSTSQMQILYFILALIMTLIQIFNAVIIKLKAKIIKLQIKKFHLHND